MLCTIKESDTGHYEIKWAEVGVHRNGATFKSQPIEAALGD